MNACLARCPNAIRVRAAPYALSLLAGAILTSSDVCAAPQTFNTALPIATEQVVLREQLLYKRLRGDPSPLDRQTEVLASTTIVGYGATGDLALFAALPVLDKSLTLRPASGPRVHRGANGIGDVRLFARYTLVQRDAAGSSLRVAPFLGLELPTGDDGQADAMGRLPPPLQPGSGSWDPFVGVVATYQTLRYQLDTQLGYQANTEGDAFELGDTLRLDGSAQYRIWPRELGRGVPGFLYLGVEANLMHQERTRIGGAKDPSSGGQIFQLAPSLQYVTRRWVLEATVQVPVAQDPNGTALEEDFTVRAGFRVNF